MDRRRLIGLNVALLAALAVVTVAGAGGVLGGQPPIRPRGEYTMISGRVQGLTTNAVYIIDAANQEMVALAWDRSRIRFEGIGHRSIAADAQAQNPGR